MISKGSYFHQLNYIKDHDDWQVGDGGNLSILGRGDLGKIECRVDGFLHEIK